jgi:hypothetical protein
MAGFNFDTDAPAAEPWDFPVTVGGVVYATREPSVDEVVAMQEAFDTDGLAALPAFLDAMIVGGPLYCGTMTTDRVLALLGAMLNYLGERYERTRRRAAAAERVAWDVAQRDPTAIAGRYGLAN